MTNPVNTNLLKVGDFFLVALIITGAALFTYNTIENKSFKNTALKAVILKDNHVVKSIDLKQKNLNQEIELNDEYNIKISAQSGKIRFSHATCPDKLCIAGGWLTQTGDTAICMPARVVVKIERNDNSIDAVSY